MTDTPVGAPLRESGELTDLLRMFSHGDEDEAFAARGEIFARFAELKAEVARLTDARAAAPTDVTQDTESVTHRTQLNEEIHMSWNITAVGKPSEVGQKVRNALKSSRSQSNHGPIFDAIEAAVDAAVAGVADENKGDTWRQGRVIFVESAGHVSSDSAQATLSIRTIYDNG